MQPQEAVFYIKDGGCIEIIGVGEEPINIASNSGKNFVACVSTSDVSIKMKNIVVKGNPSISSQNQFIIKATGGDNQSIELTDVTFQDWNSNPGHSSFVMALVSNSGKMKANLNNCKFINNKGHSGGGVLVNGNQNNKAELVMNNCYFDGNKSVKENLNPSIAAGSINARANSIVTLNESEVKNGQITGVSSTGEPLAGGIAVEKGAKLIINNSKITGNQGDGIYNAGEVVVLGNNTVNNNARYGLNNINNSKLFMEGVISFGNNGQKDMNTDPLGQIIDTTPPVIKNIKDGMTYCNDVSFEILDMYLEKVFIDNNEQTISNVSYKIKADGKLHEIVAIDKSGNSTRLKITVNKTHLWKEPIFQWDKDYSSVSAKFECNIDVSHIMTLPCKLDIKEGDEKIYVASVELDGKKYEDIRKVEKNDDQLNGENNSGIGKEDNLENGNIENNKENQQSESNTDGSATEEKKETNTGVHTPNTLDESKIYMYISLCIFTLGTMCLLKKIKGR